MPLRLSSASFHQFYHSLDALKGSLIVLRVSRLYVTYILCYVMYILVIYVFLYENGLRLVFRHAFLWPCLWTFEIINVCFLTT